MKTEVLVSLSGIFSEKIRLSTQALEDTRKGAREAPGSNVSHSDTSRFNLGNLAVGIESQLVLARETSAYLQSLLGSNIEDSPKEKISVGSLFTIIDTMAGKESNFILLVKGGGESVEVDGIKILSATSSAPIAKAFIGKKVGDEVIFNKKSYRVTRII